MVRSLLLPALHTVICWPCLSPRVPSALLSMVSVLPASCMRGIGTPMGGQRPGRRCQGSPFPTRSPAASSSSPWKPPTEHCLWGTRVTGRSVRAWGLLQQGIGGRSHGSLVGARACWETKGRAGVRRGLKWQLPIQGQQGRTSVDRWTDKETEDHEGRTEDD